MTKVSDSPSASANAVPRVSRRAFFAALAVSTAAACVPSATPAEELHAGDSARAPTGLPTAGLESFDRLLTSLLTEHQIPGAALALTHRGRLVYARGFGFADVKAREPVQPTSLFRIASVSKPITAVAVLQLVERGQLRLDDKVLAHLTLRPADDAAAIDPRWEQITIRHCLQHTAGWDRRKSFDPIGKPWDIARALAIKPPVTPDHIIQYMLGQPLDFEPGERHAYSNLGYLVLGRIVEEKTKLSYEAYAQREVWGRLGVKRPKLGRALRELRAEGEVCYYDPRDRHGPCLYPPRLEEQVPVPYGGANFDSYGAHGGWLASVVDLAKFAVAFDERSSCPLLSSETIATMWSRPDGLAGHDAEGRPKDAYYGCGWSVRLVGDRGLANTWHNGLIIGSEAVLVRRWDDHHFALAFNTHEETEPDATERTTLVRRIEGPLHAALDEQRTWPEEDLFGRYLT